MKLKYALLSLFSFVLLVGSSNLWSAGASQLERDQQMRQFREIERRLESELDKKSGSEGERIIEEEELPKQEAPKGGEVEFEVTKINTTSSEILSEEELRTILQPLEGKKIKLQALFDAVEQINQLYRDKNYLAAKAILPPQKVKAGVVNIKLIEGHLGTVQIENNESTRNSFITDRIENKPGELVNLDQLEQDLYFFNRTNDVALRAVLKPGEAAGTTDYIIQTVEPEHHEGLIFIDNAGTEDVGLERIGFSYTNRSLFGIRDQLMLGLHLAKGTRAVYGSYDVPISRRGTRLALSYDISKIEIIDGPLEPLNVTGDSTNAGLYLTHPLVVNKDLLLNGFVGVNHKTSTTDFDSVTLFDTTVDSLSLGFDAQSFDIADSWYTRHALTGGSYEDLRDENYSKYNGDANWLHIFGNNHTLSIRGGAQYSPDDLLPASEQFQIGGMYTVRGYPEGMLKGDKGYYVSFEYDIPFPPKESGPWENPFTDRWRAFAFLDHGGAFPFKGNDVGIDKDDFLTSVGVGMGINFDDTLRGRIVVGVPLVSREDGEDDVSLHFYLQNIPF